MPMGEKKRDWTIFSSHGTVLFYVAANPDSTLREISDVLGITERQIARIVKDLAEAEMLQVQHVGRRNSYQVNADAHLRHPTLSHIPLRQIIEAVAPLLTAEAREAAQQAE